MFQKNNVPEIPNQALHNLGPELFKIVRFGVVGHVLVSHPNNDLDDFVAVPAAAYSRGVSTRKDRTS